MFVSHGFSFQMATFLSPSMSTSDTQASGPPADLYTLNCLLTDSTINAFPEQPVSLHG